MDLQKVITSGKPKRERYSSKEDPRYIRLLQSSRAWKQRNKDKDWFKKKKAKQDLSLYLRIRNEQEFREKRLQIKRAYLSRPEVREKDRARIKRHAMQHPEKIRAYAKVAYAIRTGKLVRPLCCQNCGKTSASRSDGRTKIQAHHSDYSQ